MARSRSEKYRRIRGALIAQGITLRQWARSRGYAPSTVYMAAQGQRAGVVATRIQRELEEAANG